MSASITACRRPFSPTGVLGLLIAVGCHSDERKENLLRTGADNDAHTDRFKRAIARKAKRRVTAEAERDRGIWFGLGMFGLVGWSVALPSLLGLALGLWIDSRWPSRFSWTLMCLFAGVVIGCLTAWRWVRRESEGD